MAMPLVEVPPAVVPPATVPVRTTVSEPPAVLLPKMTVAFAPMPVELVPPSTVEAAAHVTAVPSAAVFANMIMSLAPEAWTVWAVVMVSPVSTTPRFMLSFAPLAVIVWTPAAASIVVSAPLAMIVPPLVLEPSSVMVSPWPVVTTDKAPDPPRIVSPSWLKGVVTVPKVRAPEAAEPSRVANPA